jgi:hypothetical protein
MNLSRICPRNLLNGMSGREFVSQPANRMREFGIDSEEE